MSVNVVDGMLTFQGEKASGCSGLNTLIVEVPFTTKIAGLVGLIVSFFPPAGVGFYTLVVGFLAEDFVRSLKVQAVFHPEREGDSHRSRDAGGQ